MTDEQIVKALECLKYGGHSCVDCKHKIHKGEQRCGLKPCNIARNAVDLIKRQQAEIDRLKSMDLQIEVSKKLEKEIKTEAIREFAERLTDIIVDSIERSLDNPNGNNYCITDVYTCIDNLVAEMTEGGKG